MKRFRASSSILILALAVSASAQRANNAPALSSRQGAAYTLYLDFNGFDFTGNWGGNAGPNAGTRTYAAYRNVNGAFSGAQQDEIRDIWARTAEKYAPFGINVTTVDPAVAAGRSGTDKQRQAFYDATARVQHSIVTPTDSNNNATAGGVSFLGVTQNAYTTTQNAGAGRGLHTNFINTPANPNYSGGTAQDEAFARKSTAETLAHEIGHALSLEHQSDYNPNGSVRDEYSDNYNAGQGRFSTDSLNGTVAPIMGFSDFTQRGLWRSGRSSPLGGAIQNDVSGILSNAGIGGYYEDGIGNSFAQATALALSGSNVDSSLAKGIVVPTSTSNPDALGAANYQGGYYSFFSSGDAITLRATNGSSLLQSGVADLGMTLRNSLSIYDSRFNLVGTATEDSLTRWTEYSGTLAAGSYYALVTSTGGFASASDATAKYFNMGSYFLSGSGFSPVPEPATLAALGLGALAFLRRRRRDGNRVER